MFTSVSKILLRQNQPRTNKKLQNMVPYWPTILRHEMNHVEIDTIKRYLHFHGAFWTKIGFQDILQAFGGSDIDS